MNESGPSPIPSPEGLPHRTLGHQEKPKQNIFKAEGLVQSSEEKFAREALAGDSFEDAEKALGKLKDLIKFQKEVSLLPFRSFHALVEGATHVNGLPHLGREKRAAALKELADQLSENIPRLSPRVADIYSALLAELSGEGDTFVPQFEEETKSKIQELRDTGDFDVLFSKIRD